MFVLGSVTVPGRRGEAAEQTTQDYTFTTLTVRESTVSRLLVDVPDAQCLEVIRAAACLAQTLGKSTKNPTRV
jgi:hypothetical protein